MPEITGETLKGTSISVIKTRLPAKSKRAMDQAAAIPKHQVERHGNARGQQRQAYRRQRLRVGERAKVNFDTFAQRVDENGRERKKQEQSQKAAAGGDQRPANRRRVPTSRHRPANGTRRGC